MTIEQIRSRLREIEERGFGTAYPPLNPLRVAWELDRDVYRAYLRMLEGELVPIRAQVTMTQRVGETDSEFRARYEEAMK